MDSRPPLHRPTDGRSGMPLLKDERGSTLYDDPEGSILYARIMVIIVAYTTPNTADLTVENTMEGLLAAACLYPSQHSTNGRVSRAGGSWYVAVDMTSASDLTAIYNCSAFFAYAFSIPLLKDKIRFDKVFSVAVAIAGVLVVAYGDKSTTKHGGKSGGSVGGAPEEEDASNRALGNIVIGVGSVLYGLYEVLYKKLACPPEGTSPGRGMVFAMTFGSLIGCFTLFVLWIPLPILHILNIERFELPHGEAAWMLLISVLANATFSGSFLVLISLTSPVLSSVAALLTIFLVAIVDWLRTGEKLQPAAVVGGLLIVAAFLLLSWSTYREMNEERRKRLAEDPIETSDDE
ncbi:hypothetical protein P7C71_g3670, partial [Lecanoromycetidae sp. Uapishka_2]